MSSYPKTATEAAEYLKQYPQVHVLIKKKSTACRFVDFDGIRMRFLAEDGKEKNLAAESALNKAHFYENGFTWSTRVSDQHISCWYLYTGPMPWKADEKGHQEWNEVFAGLNNF